MLFTARSSVTVSLETGRPLAAFAIPSDNTIQIDRRLHLCADSPEEVSRRIVIAKARFLLQAVLVISRSVGFGILLMFAITPWILAQATMLVWRKTARTLANWPLL